MKVFEKGQAQLIKVAPNKEETKEMNGRQLDII